ncbi:MAG TPA: (d)CMP kinase [Actinomycetota bacterium]|nr:(d)CMP kinase [Actinomycetota bacterium]
MIVALDGPAGAGKSTVARRVAEALDFHFLDTGAMYRAVAAAALDEGIDLDDGARLAEVAGRVSADPAGARVLLDGRDVSATLRTPEVTAAVSRVAAHPEVRRALVEEQKRLLAAGNLVIEGRDTGSAVAPEADVKVFLTATLEERARRRCVQLGRPPEGATLAETAREIAARDAADSTREASPLIKPPGALELDTTGMSLEEVVEAVVVLVRDRSR